VLPDHRAAPVWPLLPHPRVRAVHRPVSRHSHKYICSRKEDRRDFFTQMDKFVKSMGDTKQLVGALQTQLKQIEAPKPPGQSAATTGRRQITEAEVIDNTQLRITPTRHRPVNRLTL
jgi:hypothetical protein